MSDFLRRFTREFVHPLKKGRFHTNTLQKLTAGRIEISKLIFIDVHFQKGVDFVGYLLIFLGAFQQGKACLSVPLYFRGRSLDFFGGSSNPPILSIWGNHGVLLENFRHSALKSSIISIQFTWRFGLFGSPVPTSDLRSKPDS